MVTQVKISKDELMEALDEWLAKRGYCVATGKAFFSNEGWATIPVEKVKKA
jgi:hypothetical protein